MSVIDISNRYANINPSEHTCFWCGNSVNTANRHNMKTYGFCDACIERLSQGVTLVETVLEPLYPDMEPMNKTGVLVYPTSRYICLSVSDARSILPAANLEAGSKLCIDKTAFEIFSAAFNNTDK